MAARAARIYSGVARGPRDLAREQLRAALISTIAHAHRDTLIELAALDAPVPYVLEPLPLEQAIGALRNHPDDTLRWQGIAWLLDNPERAAALEPYAAKLLLAGESLPQLDPELRSSLAHGREDAVLRRTRFSTTYDWMQRRTACSPAGAVTWLRRLDAVECENFQFVVAYDPTTLTTSVTAQVDVARDITDFKPLSDPRIWADAAPLFFRRSQLVRLVANSLQPIIHPSVHDYDEQLLEEVTLGIAPLFPIDGTNLLAVRCRAEEPKPEFSVQLSASLESLIGASYKPGGLDIDAGRLTTETVTLQDGRQGTTLRGEKRVRFGDRNLCGVSLGVWLNAFASLMIAPLMAILVFEGARFASVPEPN